MQAENEPHSGAVVEATRVGSLVAFADLVAKVEQGEEITVTRDGAPVARIVPMTPAIDPEAELKAALVRMDERRKRLSLKGLSVKDLINEGRP